MLETWLQIDVESFVVAWKDYRTSRSGMKKIFTPSTFLHSFECTTTPVFGAMVPEPDSRSCTLLEVLESEII